MKLITPVILDANPYIPTSEEFVKNPRKNLSS